MLNVSLLREVYAELLDGLFVEVDADESKRPNVALLL